MVCLLLIQTEVGYQGEIWQLQGEFLRDHDGNWIWGFSMKLGHCTIEEAELWALLHGLRLA